MKNPLGLLTWCVLLGLAAPLAAPAADPRAAIYPFDVKIGGQLATVEGDPNLAVFARVKDPVPADAEVEVGGPAGMLMVSVFPVKPDGGVPAEGPGGAKIIVVPSGTRAKLDATMDKSKLAPGLYGANVIFAGGTARVMFTVK